MAATYVKLEDLDKRYTEDTHPKLWQVNLYLDQTNRLLSNYLRTESYTDVFGGIKEVGLMVFENKVNNRKVKDKIEGYEEKPLLPEILTLDMIDMIEREKVLGSESFSFSPGSSNSNFT